MIEVKNLTKKYGDNLAVNDLSFTVERGRIYGFLGPNGAGKSTTMNIITGCLAQTSGEVKIDGHDIFEDPIQAKKMIGYLPEIPPLYTDMTPYEYLRFVAQAKSIPANEIPLAIETVMKKTGISNVAQRLIRNLSKGYKQRVGIAQAMLGNPEIIILDEPTVGLDPKQIIEIRELIRSLGEEHTVILSSHILSEIQAVCDYVIIIANGKVVASDTLENISSLGEEHPVLHITAKTDPESAAKIIDAYEEVTHYAITECELGTDMQLTLDSGAPDIRERIFFDFAKQNIALTEISSRKQSLEEIYLKLTESSIQTEDDNCDENDDITDKDAENPFDGNLCGEASAETTSQQDSENEYKPVFAQEEEKTDERNI